MAHRNKVGRPPLDDDEKRNRNSLHVRVDDAVFDRVFARARADGVTMAEVVRRVLTHTEPGHPTSPRRRPGDDEADDDT